MYTRLPFAYSVLVLVSQPRNRSGVKLKEVRQGFLSAALEMFSEKEEYLSAVCHKAGSVSRPGMGRFSQAWRVLIQRLLGQNDDGV